MNFNITKILVISVLFINMVFAVYIGFSTLNKKKMQSEVASTVNLTAEEKKNGNNRLQYSFETLIVNLVGDSGRRLLKLSFYVEFVGQGEKKNSEILSEVTEKRIRLRDAIVASVSNVSIAEAADNEGKALVKKAIANALNEILINSQAVGIYFSEYELN